MNLMRMDLEDLQHDLQRVLDLIELTETDEALDELAKYSNTIQDILAKAGR